MPPSFYEQRARVTRFLQRIEVQDRMRTDYDDDLWSFFQNCWHLKDWIKNDPGVSPTVRSIIEDEVKNYDSIMISCDLANRTKHMILNRTARRDARFTGANINITVGPLNAQAKIPDGKPKEPTPPIESKVTIEHLITLNDGSVHKALDVARGAVQDWDTLLKKLNLI